MYSTQVIEWLDYKQIDEFVHEYKLQPEGLGKQVVRDKLVMSFHKYFLKYVSLLKGRIGVSSQSDTILFLSLFLAKRSKNKFNLSSVRRYLVRVTQHLDDVDIYNELVVIFLDLLAKFKFCDGVSFTAYIVCYMRWRIKKWIVKSSKDMVSVATQMGLMLDTVIDANPAPTNFDYDLTLPEFNLAWVYNPQSIIFGQLTTHERFLLYMHYKERTSAEELTKCIRRSKVTLGIQLASIRRKLKVVINKGVSHGI